MNKPDKPRRGPVLIETKLPKAKSPMDVAPVPEITGAEGRAMQVATRIAARKSSTFARMFWWVVTTLLGMMVSIAVWDFVNAMLVRNVFLGRVAVGLVVLLLLFLLIFMLREMAAFSRLSRLDKMRDMTNEAISEGSRPAAEKILKRLDYLYSSREEMRWARQSLAEHKDDIFDGPDLIALGERTLMKPLDEMAQAEIKQATRQVAAVTAIIPLALADVAIVLATNVRMVRRIAEVYGGKAGVLGSWRLLRAVATHLIATGAMAIGDDLIGSIAGGGALSKVSRRFGEGVVNGALTARVGIAAMEVCRPMKFDALKRPSVSGTVKNALVGMFKTD